MRRRALAPALAFVVTLLTVSVAGAAAHGRAMQFLSDYAKTETASVPDRRAVFIPARYSPDERGD